RVALGALVDSVLLEDRRTSKAEQLRLGEEILDRVVIVSELRAVAFVEDEYHALVAQRLEQILVRRQSSLLPARVALAGFVECEAELLDCADDDLVGGVVREQSSNERSSVGVLLDAAFLKAVEFLARLAVEILAVHHEDALVDRWICLEQRRGLEAGERLAATGGVPDVTVAKILVDALDDVLDGVDLVGPHHQQLLLAGNEDHVAADRLSKRALREKRISEAVDALDLRVVRSRVFVYW